MRSIILLALLTAGCAKKPGTYKIATSTGGSASESMAAGDALWAQRNDKGKLTEALNNYEKAFAEDPTNRQIAAKLVRGWYLMGDAHEQEKTAKMEAWDKAVAFGEKCLALNTDYKAVLEKSGSKVEAIGKAKKEDVPCIYWSASSLGKWAKLNGIIQSIKHKSTLFSFISKVQELEPDYFHGAANRYWGAYYSVIPSFAGRDLNKSKSNFDKSLEIAPYYLGTYVLMAENWAVNSQNVEEFDQAIQYVVASDVEALEGSLAIENAFEIEKAKEIWKKRDSYFQNPGKAAPLKNQPPKKQAEPAPAKEEAAPANEEAAPAKEEAATETKPNNQ